MRKVTIYVTPRCGYCRRAKVLLDRLHVPFQEIDLEADDRLRAWLVEVTGRRTVPQIFFGDEAIGGFAELQALEAAGTLLDRLEERGGST